MSIINLQRGIAEAGRIRIGQQVPISGTTGKTRPAKLDTFRLTSADRRRIEQAAELWGGDVVEWQAPAGKQWQVITKADALEVIVPPSDLSFSQNYELWSAGGCQRRCDGVTEAIGEQPCVCDPGARECDIHTRLSVLLRDMPGLGVWRLDTSGYYAAVELASAVEIIQLAAGRGALLPARLRLEQRSVKRPGKDGKPQTLRFAVPVLDIEISPAELLSGGAQPIPIETVTRPAMTPVPQLTTEMLRPSIAEQSVAPVARPTRANAAPPIPSSGRQRGARAAGPAAVTEQPGPVVDGEGLAADPHRPAPVSQPEPVQAQGVEAEPGGALSDPSPAPGSPPAPASRPRKAKDAADESDPEYWMKRVHAGAKEHGIDHDGLRTVAAAELGVSDGDLQAFSMTDLVPADFQQLDSLLRSLPDPIEGEDGLETLTSRWVFQRAWTKGLTEWEPIDAVVVACTGKQPEALSAADWIAWTIRLTAGEYDAQRGAA